VPVGRPDDPDGQPTGQAGSRNGQQHPGLSMNFVHAADLHLDSPLRNLALSDEASSERLRRATRGVVHARD
jgi:hypothetical protein